MLSICKFHVVICRFEFIANIDEQYTDDWTKVLTNCTLLHDSEVSYNGIRIYGCPWYVYFVYSLFGILNLLKYLTSKLIT